MLNAAGAMATLLSPAQPQTGMAKGKRQEAEMLKGRG